MAREYEVALPHELGPEARRQLARVFAEEVVARFGVVADVAVHEPGRDGDQRNWHAHVLTTTREVSSGGMGAKTRALDVKQTSGPAVEQLRELWGRQVNQALERAQEAEQHLGPAAAAMERQVSAGAQWVLG